MCDACGICAQYGQSAPKEPMKSLPIPTRPWQVVSQDICELHKQSYLVTVCHFSDWIEVDKLAKIPYPPQSSRKQNATSHDMVFQQPATPIMAPNSSATSTESFPQNTVSSTPPRRPITLKATEEQKLP